MQVRSPYDLMNLAVLFGMNQAQAKASVSNAPCAVLAHGKTRSGTCKGVLTLRSMTTAPPGDEGKPHQKSPKPKKACKQSREKIQT